MQQNWPNNDGPDTIKAIWAPVYFEPIRHSGERITIANAILSPENNIIKVLSTLNPSVLRCLFGNRQDEILHLVDIIISDLQSHLHAHSTLESWQPMLSGVFLGKVRKIKDYSIEKMLEKIIPATSSLGVTEEKEAINAPHTHKWTTQIKNIVTIKHPHLQKCFDKELYVNNHRIGTIGFVGNKLAANFTEVKPVVNITNAIDQSLRRLMLIKSFSARADLYGSQEWTGMIVHQTNVANLSYLQQQNAASHLERIKAHAEDLNIPVKCVESTEQAADFILKNT